MNDLVPSLRDAVQGASLNPDKIAVALECDGGKILRIPDKHRVLVSDGTARAPWQAAMLRELFRGDRKPPADIDHYPEAYTPYFFFIEAQVITLCDTIGDRTDQELEEIFFALRRRPDGRSLGPVHDFLWQVCALLLGRYVLSEAEFEGIIGALLGSTRKWGLKPVSRNYLDYIRSTLGPAVRSSRRS
jgi:hypothetical protein